MFKKLSGVSKSISFSIITDILGGVIDFFLTVFKDYFTPKENIRSL